MKQEKETFANYILSEKDFKKKMQIVFYLQKKTGIFYDKTVIFKSEIAKLFMDNQKLDVDENLVLTASLLCNCKKKKEFLDLKDIYSYAEDGAKYLSTLGFNKRFCKICSEFNRYSNPNGKREKESDILELADQYGGMLLDRPERRGLDLDDAEILLEYRNLKGKDNIYLPQFKRFLREMKEVYV